MATFGSFETQPAAVASGDLSSVRWHAVRYLDQDAVCLATSKGAYANCGILYNTPQNGEAATVIKEGPAKVVCGSSVAVNALFTVSASGRAITANSGDLAMGRVLQAAAADGDIVSCMVFAVTLPLPR